MKASLPALVLIATFVCAWPVRGQERTVQPQQSLILRGCIKSITFEDHNSSDYVIVSLQYALTNTGPVPIIFWNTQPVFTGLKLATTPAFTLEDVVVTYGGGPSIDTSSEWSDTRKALDKEYPPPALTVFLKPGGSSSFEATVTLVCPKNPISGLLHHPSLRDLERMEALWLRVYYQVWSRNLEPDLSKRADLVFGHSLRSRWNAYGILWLDDIYSEPIKLELKKSLSSGA